MTHLYGSGQLISIDFYCDACQQRSWDTIPKKEATYDNRWDCNTCGGVSTIKRIPSATRVHTRTFPDGYKRAGFEDLKEAAKLEIELNGAQTPEQAKLKREINKLSSRD